LLFVVVVEMVEVVVVVVVGHDIGFDSQQIVPPVHPEVP